jgi:putative inorganic carbon (hco3(-)) transporter
MSRSIDYSVAAGQAVAPRFRFGQVRAVISAEAGSSGMAISFKLLLVFLLVLYSNIAQLYPPLNVFRPALLAAVAATAMMFIEVAKDRQGFKLSWPQGYLLLALMGTAAVSTLQAIYVRLGYETTSDLAKVALIYLVIENTVTSEKRIKAVLWTLVLGGLFPAIGTIHHFRLGILQEGTRASWIGIFKNANEDAYALILLLPLALILSSTSKWLPRIVLWGVASTYLLAIYLTFSRGGLVGLFAVLALFGWKQKSILLKILMVAGLAASVLVVSLFWNRKDNFDDLGKDTTVNQRIATIKAGFAMFLDKPVLGVGPGCSMVAYPLYVPKDAHCGCQDQLVVHNAFMQVLSEMGAIGFVVFMAFLGITIFQLWRIQRQRTRAEGPLVEYATGLELALWGFVACGLSGGFSYTWFPYILIGVAVATKRVFDMKVAENACQQ